MNERIHLKNAKYVLVISIFYRFKIDEVCHTVIEKKIKILLTYTYSLEK
jgi:hypothetical protein